MKKKSKSEVMKKEDNLPMISSSTAFTYILRSVFLANEMCPQILHEATGVDLPTCIDFCAKNITAKMFDDPPKIKIK